LLDKKK